MLSNLPIVTNATVPKRNSQRELSLITKKLKSDIKKISGLLENALEENPQGTLPEVWTPIVNARIKLWSHVRSIIAITAEHGQPHPMERIAQAISCCIAGPRRQIVVEPTVMRLLSISWKMSAELEREIEQACQKMSQTPEVLAAIDTVYNSLTPWDRHKLEKALTVIAHSFLVNLGIPQHQADSLAVTFNRLPASNLGSYDRVGININSHYLSVESTYWQSNPQELILTTLHESRHAYQDLLAALLPVTAQAANLTDLETCKVILSASFVAERVIQLDIGEALSEARYHNSNGIEVDANGASAIAMEYLWSASKRSFELAKVPSEIASLLNFSNRPEEHRIRELNTEISRLVLKRKLPTSTKQQETKLSRRGKYATIERSFAVLAAGLKHARHRREELLLLRTIDERFAIQPTGYLGALNLLSVLRAKQRSSTGSVKAKYDQVIRKVIPLARKELAIPRDKKSSLASDRQRICLKDLWKNTSSNPAPHHKSGVELVRMMGAALERKDPISLVRTVAMAQQTALTYGLWGVGTLARAQAQRMPKGWSAIFNGSLSTEEKRLIAQLEYKFRKIFNPLEHD